MHKLTSLFFAFLFPLFVFAGMIFILPLSHSPLPSPQIISSSPLVAPTLTQSHELFFFEPEDQTIRIGHIRENTLDTTVFRPLENPQEILALSPSPQQNAVALLTKIGINVVPKIGELLALPKDAVTFLWSLDGQQYLYQTKPDELNQSEVHVVSLINPESQRVIPLDLSDVLETSGTVTFIWLPNEKMLYAPEVTDEGGLYFYELKTGSDHQTESPTLFTEIFRVELSPLHTLALIETLSPESDTEHLYGLIDLVTNKKTITSISTDSTLCNWANETDWLCLTEGGKDRSQIGLLNPQTGNYQLLGFAQTIKREKLKQLSYHEATKELLLLYVDDDKIHRIQF